MSPLSLRCVWVRVGGGERAATTEQKIYYDSSNLTHAPQMDTCHPAHARGWVPGLVILHVAVVVVVGAVRDAPAVVRHADDGVYKKPDRVVQPLARAKALVAAATRLTSGCGEYTAMSDPNSSSTLECTRETMGRPPQLVLVQPTASEERRLRDLPLPCTHHAPHSGPLNTLTSRARQQTGPKTWFPGQTSTGARAMASLSCRPAQPCP